MAAPDGVVERPYTIGVIGVFVKCRLAPQTSMTYLTIMKKFDSERLYTWRVGNNLTQAQAAKVLGVATGTLKNWEQGIRGIPTTIELLVEKLKHSDLPTDRGSEGKRPIGIRKHVKQKR